MAIEVRIVVIFGAQGTGWGGNEESFWSAGWM